MKKISTLSLALLAVSSAYAIEPVAIQAPEASSDVNAEAQAVRMMKATEASKADAMLRSTFDVQAKAPSRAEGGEVTVQYGFPAGTLFNYPIFSDNGVPGYSLVSPTFTAFPAYADVTFPNNSFSLVDGKPKRAKDLNYVWTFGEGENAYDEESSYDLTYANAPGLYNFPYGQGMPVLSYGGNTFQIGQTGQTTTGETEFFPNWIVSGGAPYISQEQLDRWASNPNTSTWSDFDAIFRLIDFGVEGSDKYYNEGSFMLGNGLKSASVNKDWEKILGEMAEGDLMDHVSDVKLGGLGMVIDNPGQAWSISEISLTFSSYLEPGAKFDICFYGLTAEDKPDYDNEIAKFTYETDTKIGTLSKNESIEVNVPFVTVDEYGDELSYKRIEGGMFLIVKNCNDKVKKLCPTMAGYPYTRGGTVVNNFYYDTLYAFLDCKYDNEDVTYQVSNPYIFGDEATDKWTLPVGFNITMKAEYPYLQADSYVDFAAKKWVATEDGATEFTVNLKKADDKALYRVLCPANLEDVVISGPDGTEIPEWLAVGVESGNVYFEDQLAANQDMRAFVIQFQLADGATPSGTQIFVSYKGFTNVFKINPELSGIDSVVESGAETVSSEYYDLQGRKLYGEPANGLFIRKDIKADGSVKAVKIAK